MKDPTPQEYAMANLESSRNYIRKIVLGSFRDCPEFSVDDIVQDIMLRAIKSFANFRQLEGKGLHQSLMCWLNVISNSVCIDRIRSIHTKGSTEELFDNVSVKIEMISPYLYVCDFISSSNASPEEKLCIALHSYNMDHREISALLSIAYPESYYNPAKVGNMLSKVRHTLRKMASKV